jgi:shikimate kinase
LRQHGQVFYLRSSPEEVFRRLRHDQNRPLLQVADPQARLRELLKTRDPLYRAAAHYVIETGRPNVTALVSMIVSQLELAGHLKPVSPPATADRPRVSPPHRI